MGGRWGGLQIRLGWGEKAENCTWITIKLGKKTTTPDVPAHYTLPPPRHYFVSWLREVWFWHDTRWHTSQEDILLQSPVCHRDKILLFAPESNEHSFLIHSFIHRSTPSYIYEANIYESLSCSRHYAFHSYHSYSTCERPQNQKTLKTLFRSWHLTSLGNSINTHGSNIQLQYF